MDPVSSVGLKLLAPAARKAYGALRLEWARRQPAGGYGRDLARLEPVLDEALGVLAGQAEGLVATAKVGLKGLIARPKLFSAGAPRDWIASDGAQTALKKAVFGLLRQGDDSDAAAAAIAHYRLFDQEDGEPPDADLVYGQAIGFLLVSLERAMTVGERVLFEALDGLAERVSNLVSADAVDIIDAEAAREVEHIRKRRFFVSSGTSEAAIALAAMVSDGRLKSASPIAKARAFAWCARWVCYSEAAVAADLLTRARTLTGALLPEIIVATAFLRGLELGATAVDALAIERSPLEATAWLQILQKYAGRDAMLERARAAEIGLEALDGDGRYVLISNLLQADRWEEALRAIADLGAADYDAAPALLWVAATALVADTLPPDLRPAVLQDVPIHPADLPLAESGEAVAQRRTARALMLDCERHCRALGLDREAAAAERYALWLDLRDPAEREDALGRLTARVHDPATQVEHINLALGFALPRFEPELAEQAIARAVARNPKGDIAVAAGALALIFDEAQRSPKKALELLARYRELIHLRADPDSLLSFELRLLVDDGRLEEARARFAEIDLDRVPPGQRAFLAQSLDTTEGNPSLEVLEQLYADGEATPILSQLVEQHRRLGYSERYLELARKLITTTRAAADALKVIRFLEANGHGEEAQGLLADIEALLPISDELRSEAAWLFFNAGRFDRAEAELALLEASRDHHNDRALRYHLLVATGRWPELDGLIESEWRKRDERSPLDLIQLATLAAHTKAKRLREIIETAVERAPDDPHVLIGAFNAATAAGLEEEFTEAGHWLNRAAELSGEDGPIQVQSIDELIARQPEWNQRVEDCYRDFASSNIPFPVAAGMLSRPWLELQLAPMVANPGQADARRRPLVPLFSAKRAALGAENLPSGIALDRTAIITLAYLGQLDSVLKRFDRVTITHGILRELFGDSQRIEFHQPSKTAFAHELVRLLGRHRVRRFQPTTSPEAGLAADIGDVQAALLTEAAAQDGGQHIVIHPNPITRVGSLLREPVPLDRFAAHLGSCSAVVDALVRAGVLTTAEQARARAYLDRNDRRWPDEQRIERGATLYLSDLSVDYFRYTRILAKIEQAGLTVIVSPTEIDEAHALLDHEGLAGEVMGMIEAVRLSLSRAIADGRILFDGIRRLPQAEEEDDETPDSADPMIATGMLAGRAPVLVSDDRFFNRYERFDHREGSTRILTSLDLLALLAGEPDSGIAIDEIRTTLRQAGALFVPLPASEFRVYLEHSTIDGDALHESAELRAIRENIRLIQLRGWFDVESDIGWLISVHNALVDGLVAQWRDDVPDNLARARSRWIVNLLDMREWSDLLPRPAPDHLATHGIIAIQAKLVLSGIELDGDPADRFAAWLESEGLDDPWTEEPRLRPIALDYLRRLVLDIADDDTLDANEFGDTLRGRLALNMLPPFLRLLAVSDRDFRARMGVSVEGRITLGKGLAEFASSAFLAGVRAVYAAGGADQPVVDSAGVTWTMSAEAGDGSWPLTVRRDDALYRLRGHFDLHPDPEIRLRALDATAHRLGLAADSVADWRAILAERPLGNDEVDLLADLLALSPIASAEAIAASVEANEASFGLLVPTERAYYEQLTGPAGAATIAAYAGETASPLLDRWLSGGDEAARYALLLGGHPSILRAGEFDRLGPDDWDRLGAWVAEAGDLLAKIGFIERALPLAASQPVLEARLIGLIDEIEALDPADEDGRLHYACSLFILVDGELSRNQALIGWPPFRRRIAAFAQASIIERETWMRVDRKGFAENCTRRAGWRFVAQSFVDLRAEPRWHPDHIDPKQMRFEMLGRILNAANELGADGLPESLRTHLFDAEKGVQGRLRTARLFWPGPIEGAVRDTVEHAPADIAKLIDTMFDEEPFTLAGMRGIIQASNLYLLADHQIDRAVDRLRTSGPHLLDGVDAEELQAYLLGLAFVAASHRHHPLAEQVEILARHRRQVFSPPISITEEMHVALAAAAARPDPREWRTALGNSIAAIALGLTDIERAEQLISWIETLVIIDPLLRAKVGRTTAGLKLLLGR